jgi:hypothetical protein
MARLWHAICSNRHLTHYGEEHCRLDRTTPLYGGRVVRRSRLLSLVSRLFFRIPDTVEEKLEEQFIDDLVMRNQWELFMQRQIADWKQSIQWSFALLV